MLEGWRITKNGDECCGCGDEFRPNRAFYSCLIDQAEGFARQDYCTTCWEDKVEGAADGTGGPGPFCFWRTRRAPAEQKQVVDTGLMLEFFDRLKDGANEQKRAFRFVLALYLMRRKEFKLIEVDREGGGLVFERRSCADKVTVADPSLTEEQIQDAAAQLSQLLSASLAGSDR